MQIKYVYIIIAAFFVIGIILLIVKIGDAQDAHNPCVNSPTIYDSLEKALEDKDNVCHIVLSYKNLSTMPFELTSFPNLKILDLSHNSFTQFPVEVLELTNLRYLDLSYNKLESIPPGIGKLTNLRMLNLNYTDIFELPAEIANLSKLDTLGLAGNGFNEAPKALQNTHVKYIDYTDNPFPTK
ncbi:hypothetical protein BH09PAT2_BH09PAT2_09520 [soil metagenome]